MLYMPYLYILYAINASNAIGLLMALGAYRLLLRVHDLLAIAKFLVFYYN